MRRRHGTVIVFALAVLAARSPHAQKPAEPSLEQVMERVGAYVAGYGEKASVVVSTEKYTQSVIWSDSAPMRPLQLEAEFAIVRLAGGGWTGYRDVVSLDGKPVHDRRNRLMELLTDTNGDVSELTRIANESARFNVGPVSRNFNVPTATLFFFPPRNHVRFAFERKGTRKIDDVTTWEVTFKETQRPTLVGTRAGKDVPLEGSLWINPQDGTVIRTRLKLRNFADDMGSTTVGDLQAPVQVPAENPNAPRGARPAPPSSTIAIGRIESSADIEVTYRVPEGMTLWLPFTMVELYEGPIRIKARSMPGRATTNAKYSDFKTFDTSIKIVGQ
jgi:hypothetical protein